MGKRLLLGLITLSLSGLAVTNLTYHDPLIIWNRTESVPKGFYFIRNTPLERGMLVAYRPTKTESEWLRSRGIAGKDWPLLKHVMALEGDTICWRSGRISVNNKHVGTVLSRVDLAAIEGCVQLEYGDVFLMNAHPGSVDGRYFGIQKTRGIIGAASPIWIGRHRASQIGNQVISGDGREAGGIWSRRARLKARLTRATNLLSAHLFLCDAPSGGPHLLDQRTIPLLQNASIKIR